jgi:lysophospholipase L1-like esterase
MNRFSAGLSGQRRALRLCIGFLAAFMWQVSQNAQATELGKIMPMGDSITLGYNVNGGYRAPLYTLLTNRADTFTFVGSQTGYPTDALTAAGQAHHEGHSGYVITNGTSRSGLDENLASWIGPGAASPDKILLMIGSNDINLSYDMTNAPTRLSNLVSRIYGYLPNVKLYLASIIPMVGHESDVQAFNAAIPGIAASHRALGHDVVYVPMHDALDIGTDLNDGLHPNAQGYQRMASAWDAALHTAASTHAVDVTGAGGGPGGGSAYSVGWEFSVTRTLVVTSLGQFDPDSNSTSNAVAIYQKGGAKVVEATVLTNSLTVLSGNYSARYVPVVSTVLTAGTYVVFSTQNGNNFIATNGSPTATFGSAITWNKGVAQDAGPLPASAPATWQIENADACRYFGPTFTYDEAPLTVTLVSPLNNQAFAAGASVSVTVTVANATGDYTVHVYTNSSSGAFAEAGTGGAASPYVVSLGTPMGGLYHVYASVTDTLATTNSATNAFTVASVLQAGQQILSLTGWNQDLIIGKSETAPGYGVSMGGWVYYEKGLSGGTLGLPADSAGTNRTFTSSRNPSVQFQFQPYAAASNALFFNGPGSATLTLTAPAKFQSLQFLETTRSMTWYAKLNFSDGSSTATATWSDPDWTASPGPSDRCLTTYGLKSTSGSFYTGYLWMAQRDYTLAVADQYKTLNSITFYTTGAAGNNLAVFAVSGYVLGSLAGTNHAVDVTSAGDGASGGANYSVGWDFTVTQPIKVKSLGQFDPNGTAVSNRVAIYQRAGAKLVEASVLADSPSEPSGNYSTRYAAIDDLVLTNGNYVVFSTQNGDNFIAGNGSPAAAFGPGVTWNMGLALVSGSAAGPLPASASSGWAITNATAFRYFGPTFKYELVVPPPTLTLSSPTNNQVLAVSDATAIATVSNAVGTYTVHIYTNSGSSAFAEAGTGSTSTPYQVSLSALPAGGTYHVYAAVTDTFSTTNTMTNTFTVAVKIGQQTMNVAGWNQDLIIGRNETAPGYSVSMGGWNFYEKGLTGGSQGLPADTEGTNRMFTSSRAPAVMFQFAPYVGKNALFFQGASNATLRLVNPSKFYALQFLETTRTATPPVRWNATLKFSDGSSTISDMWGDPDWVQTGPSDTGLTYYGLRKTIDNSFFTNYLWIADRRVTLSKADRYKTLNSITFTTVDTGDRHLAVFAVSGYAFGTTTNDFHAVDVTSAGSGAAGGGTYSVGWDFTVAETVTITSLGQFDPDSNPKTNTVALYQRGGAKLAEVTVYPTSSAESSGNYSARYAKIGRLILSPGNYVVVSTQNGDNYIASSGNPTASFGPAITWNKGVALASGSSAGPLPGTAPSTWAIEDVGKYRYFGPTFKYELRAIWPEGTIIRLR